MMIAELERQTSTLYIWNCYKFVSSYWKVKGLRKTDKKGKYAVIHHDGSTIGRISVTEVKETW